MGEPLPPGKLTVVRIETDSRDPRTPVLGASYPLDSVPFYVGIGCTRLDAIELFISGISRRQAAFTVEDGAWHVDDTWGSTYGIWIGGQRVTAKRKLSYGDQIVMGPLGDATLPTRHRDGIVFEFSAE